MRGHFYNRYDGKSLISATENWPTEGQELFANPAERSNEPDIVQLNWLKSESNDLMMPSAYKDAADFLVEALRKGGDGNHSDRFLFPILYLYRHALELELKEIIRLGIRLGDVPNPKSIEKKLGGHSLLELWKLVESLMTKHWPEGNQSDLIAAKSILTELHRLDNDGQHLRYWMDKEKKPYIYPLPDLIDLSHLRAVFDGLWSMLEGTETAFMEDLSIQRALESEYGP